MIIKAANNRWEAAVVVRKAVGLFKIVLFSVFSSLSLAICGTAFVRSHHEFFLVSSSRFIP